MAQRRPPQRPLVVAEGERRQIERVLALRAQRDARACAAALAAIGAAAREGANLIPTIVAAVEARATLGEISDGLREVFGVFEEA